MDFISNELKLVHIQYKLFCVHAYRLLHMPTHFTHVSPYILHFVKSPTVNVII